MSTPCRVCSECDGNHHWLEHCGPVFDEDADGNTVRLFGDDTFTGFTCKHCDAVAEMCDECGDPIFPWRTTEFCKECELLQRDEDGP